LALCLKENGDSIIHETIRVNLSLHDWRKSGKELYFSVVSEKPRDNVARICQTLAHSIKLRHDMPEIEREHGEQPIHRLMTELNLENADLVSASTEQLTFKMVAKARKGRYLTMNVRLKVLHALQKASGNTAYSLDDLFNYR